MSEHKADIVIFGAGIAGLWAFHRLKALGYNVLLLEREAIGCGQTLASQGIIHSGLKYAFAGKINELAKSISAMPDIWRDALNGQGDVDLSAAQGAISSQYLMIPPGMMGDLIALASKKALGGRVREIARDEWPGHITRTGFTGTLIYMDEPVLDIAQIIRALAEPYKDSIRYIGQEEAPYDYLARHSIDAKQLIFTAAGSNAAIAQRHGHDKNLKTQTRPLLMGMMNNAPYPLFAHLVGASEKPVATITSHNTKDGSIVWYIGGSVAERAKDSAPEAVYNAARAAFAKYMPEVDLSGVEWSSLPIDRVEGQSGTKGWMPDRPATHAVDNALYCWPTKLTFAPMLSDMIIEHLNDKNIAPSRGQTDWGFLPPVDYARAPWDKAQWSS